MQKGSVLRWGPWCTGTVRGDCGMMVFAWIVGQRIGGVRAGHMRICMHASPLLGRGAVDPIVGYR